MTTAVVSMYGQGQITLPKAWRDKFDTKHFAVEINENELTIKPILEKLFKKGKKLDPDLADFYEALEDIKNGNLQHFDSFDEFANHVLQK
jgi:AbrB family looped-hinge helix DNA binding protein